MWASAAGAALTFFSGRKSEKDKAKQTKENILLEGKVGRENSQFNAEQEYYYRQLARQEAKRGLDQFRKFSTVANYAPQYRDTNPGPILPTKPTYNQGQYSDASSKKSTSNSTSGLAGLANRVVGV